ncbi:hypothetical protein FRC07_002368 [Ceratobasidium sp. 392]|nr:hypothetical protein FRC07_002368 [Ceratobasidium sp. 392]
MVKPAAPETSRKASTGARSLPKDVAIIVLFGATGAGKSTFANLASGKNDLAVGHGVKSCTQEVDKTNIFMVDRRPVILVDCPGFDDTHLSDVEILKRIAGFLAFTYSNDTKITGLLYLHRITDNRFGGAGRRNFRMFRKMCGTDSLKNVVVVTNMWSQPPTETELAREIELRDGEDFFQDILSEGAQMVRHSEPTRESAYDIIRCVLGKAPVVPELSRQIVDEGKDLDKTDAGLSLGEELAEALRRGREEVERLRAEQAEAIREKDEKWKRDLDIQEKKANERTRALEVQVESLKQGHGAQQADWQKMFMETQEKYFSRMTEMQKEHNERVDKLIYALQNQDRGICIIA